MKKKRFSECSQKNKTQIDCFSSKTRGTYLKSYFKKKETTKNIFSTTFFFY